MTATHSLAIAVDEQFTIHRRTQSAGEMPTLSSRLGALLSSFVAEARFPRRSQPVSGYYKGAAERACASAPVTSLRQIAGTRR